MYTKIAAGIFTLIFILSATPAYAADIRSGDRVSVSANERISENLYAAGGQVTISGTLTKDALIAGGQVVVNTPVLGDVAIAGGSVTLLEQVQGDVRIFGGQITISAPVGGDVVVFGGAVTILPGATVGGDLLVAGGSVSVEGDVNGKVKAAGGTILIDSTVAGPVTAHAATSIELGANARIGSDFAYTAPQEATLAEGAQVSGETAFTQLNTGSDDVGAALVGVGIVFGILLPVIFAIATLTILFALPRFTNRVVDATVKTPWKELGLGFAAMIVIPVAALVLFVTIVGMFVGGIVLIGFMLAAAVAKALSGVVAGAYLARIFKKEAIVSWRWALLGVIVVSILGLVPVLGWLVLILLYSLTFGAVVSVGFRMLRSEHS